MDPISLSAYGFCQGLDGLETHLADAHAGDPAPEHVAVDGVAIPQQPSRRRVVRKRFNHLLRRPRRRGMFRDVDVDDSPAVVAEQDQARTARGR